MVEIKHLCLCLLFSSTHFSIYKDTFAFYKDTKCVQGHAILMPGLDEAGARAKQLSKELRRIFKEQGNDKKSLFRAKICEKKTFYWEKL